MLYDVETKENVCTALLINQLLLGKIYLIMMIRFQLTLDAIAA